MNRIGKTELTKLHAKNTGQTHKQAQQDLDQLIGLIIQLTEQGTEISIPKFGTFKVISRKSYKGTNPQTHKPLTIPAKQILRFTPSSSRIKII